MKNMVGFQIVLSHMVEEAISIRESNMSVSCSYESNYL